MLNIIFGYVDRRNVLQIKFKDFLLYFKHIYEMEKNTTVTTAVLKKWEPLLLFV